MTDFQCGTSVVVPDGAILWRVEKLSEDHIWWSDELGRWVPRLPNALVFDKELSTFWSQHLEEVHGGASKDVTIVRVGPAVVFACGAQQLRELFFDVLHDPVQDLPTPPGCAHVLARYPEGATKAERRKLRSEVVRHMTHDLRSGEIGFSRPPSSKP